MRKRITYPVHKEKEALCNLHRMWFTDVCKVRTQGIRRLEKIADKEAEILRDYVICQKCNVAVKKVFQKNYEDPIFGKPGLYCPECEELLFEAPEDWKRKMNQ